MGANGNGYGKKLLAQVLFDCNYYNLTNIEVSNLTGDNEGLIRSISVIADFMNGRRQSIHDTNILKGEC